MSGSEHRPPRRAGCRHPHDRREAGRSRESGRRGGARRVQGGCGEAARPRQEDGSRAGRAPARQGLVHRARRVRPAPLDVVRDGEAPPVRRRRGDRLRHRGRPPGVCLQPGRDRVRRQPRPGLRGEDRQDHRLRAEDRLSPHRSERGRRGPDPGGRRVARPVRGDLPPQHPRLRRDPADLADHGRGRRRSRLLPRADRLRRDGGPDLTDVHHRSRRDQDRHRRGRQHGGARRRPDPQHQVRQRALPRRRRGGRHLLRQGAALLPAAEQPRGRPGLRRAERPHAQRGRS